jgi:proline iminopeptidase
VRSTRTLCHPWHGAVAARSSTRVGYHEWMRKLYSEIEPYARHSHDTGDGHVLYVEEAGTRDGIPVIFLHGGPGSGCNDGHRRYFDPSRYRIVLFDQRGCARSTPAGEIIHNTTPHLLGDLESIRQRLGIDRWCVFGGSWGATLALLYAQTHPERVSALILRGSFLARPCDLDWFISPRGAPLVYPELWQRFVDSVPAGPGPLLQRAARALGEDRPHAESLAVADAWSTYAGAVVTLSLPDAAVEAQTSPPDPATTIAKVRIEMHYATAGYFIREGQVLDDIHRVPEVPTFIVHGRRDLTCPVAAAFALHEALPHAHFTIVREAGHLASEPGNIDALVNATDALARELKTTAAG